MDALGNLSETSATYDPSDQGISTKPHHWKPPIEAGEVFYPPHLADFESHKPGPGFEMFSHTERPGTPSSVPDSQANKATEPPAPTGSLPSAVSDPLTGKDSKTRVGTDRPETLAQQHSGTENSPAALPKAETRAKANASNNNRPENLEKNREDYSPSKPNLERGEYTKPEQEKGKEYAVSVSSRPIDIPPTTIGPITREEMYGVPEYNPPHWQGQSLEHARAREQYNSAYGMVMSLNRRRTFKQQQEAEIQRAVRRLQSRPAQVGTPGTGNANIYVVDFLDIGAYYVGQAKSNTLGGLKKATLSRYQSALSKWGGNTNNTRVYVVETLIDITDSRIVDAAEETWIRRLGGPYTHGGRLLNERYQMLSEHAYRTFLREKLGYESRPTGGRRIPGAMPPSKPPPPPSILRPGGWGRSVQQMRSTRRARGRNSR